MNTGRVEKKALLCNAFFPTRPANTGVKNDAVSTAASTHYPCLRPVNTGSVYRPLGLQHKLRTRYIITYLLSGSIDRKSFHVVSSTRLCHEMCAKFAVQQIKSTCRPKHPIASVAGRGKSVNLTSANRRNQSAPAKLRRFTKQKLNIINNARWCALFHLPHFTSSTPSLPHRFHDPPSSFLVLYVTSEFRPFCTFRTSLLVVQYWYRIRSTVFEMSRVFVWLSGTL